MMKVISAQALRERLDAGEAITVIDVREGWELQRSAVDFAKHIPMNDIPDRIDEVPKDSPVVIMCKVGGRSAQVTEYLDSLGYENVSNLEGGILGWARQIDPALPKIY
jgi:rhodanese-related sulfurtransferase